MLIDSLITIFPQVPQLKMMPEYLKITVSCFILARLNFVLKKCEINFEVVGHFKTQLKHGHVVSIGCFLAAVFLVL
jgi:hypothetical protein